MSAFWGSTVIGIFITGPNTLLKIQLSLCAMQSILQNQGSLHQQVASVASLYSIWLHYSIDMYYYYVALRSYPFQKIL